MLKIDRQNQSVSFLDTLTLADVSITEHCDLHEFISDSPDAFFKEFGLELFLIGKEIAPSKNVQDRIDLLGQGWSMPSFVSRFRHRLSFPNQRHKKLHAVEWHGGRSTKASTKVSKKLRQLATNN